MPAIPKKDGVVAIIQNAAGNYLLIRRGLSLSRAPGVWCFVGGQVEHGEAFDAAIVREVYEEVGLSIEPVKKVHESISPNGEFRLHWFSTRLLDPAQPVRPHATEVAESRWLTFDEAVKLDPILPTLKAWLQAQHT